MYIRIENVDRYVLEIWIDIDIYYINNVISVDILNWEVSLESERLNSPADTHGARVIVAVAVDRFSILSAPPNRAIQSTAITTNLAKLHKLSTDTQPKTVHLSTTQAFYPLVSSNLAMGNDQLTI